MASHVHDSRHEALAFLAHVSRARARDETDDLERRFRRIVQRLWASKWSEIEPELLAIEAKNYGVRLSRIREQMRGWLTEDQVLELTQPMAEAYGRGHRVARSVEVDRSVITSPEVDHRVIRSVDDAERMVAAAIGSRQDFTVVDKRAAAWLRRDVMFWVGNVWDQHLGRKISDAVLETVVSGEPRAKTTELLKQRLSQFNRPDSYWDIVAAAGHVRARTMGNLQGFVVADVAEFEFVSMGDEKVSPICREMNGKVFTMEQASSFAADVLSASSPEDHKRAWPWPKLSEVQNMPPEALAASGIMVPPLHGRCRSRIVARSFRRI